jgi:hypothetical protein
LPLGRWTSAAMTPGMLPTSSRTADAQCPHVIPLTVTVNVLMPFPFFCISS